MKNYARIVDGTVYQNIESETQPGPELGNWVACPDWVGPGCTTTDNITFTAPVVVIPVLPQHATKRAFQNRFPLASNGISTKWDAMCLFQQDDGYAASLGVTGAALYGLRMLITTGMQRLNASPYVDLGASAEAAGLLTLLVQPTIPADFRISTAERDAMLTTPVTDVERYTG